MTGESGRQASRPAGVREVAALAGVSTQTVSRVVNEHPGVRDETRRRVLGAMDELGYRVNNVARALGTRRTRTLGVIASDATLYGPSIGIAALEAAARAEGHWITAAYADAADAASVDDAVAHLLGQGVDGLILLAPHAQTLDAVTGAAHGVPVASLHLRDGFQRQAEGAGMAVAHLAGLGHRRIARIGGPADWLEETARADGWERAAEASGIDTIWSWRGDWSARAGGELAGAVADAIASPDAPTAVVVANDQMALGLVSGLATHGVSVPGGLSVVGFDDNPDAAYYRPALTTVRLDIPGEARRCVAEVLGRDDAPTPGPATLVVRDSTTPPTAARSG